VRLLVFLCLGLWSSQLSAQFIRDYETERQKNSFQGEAWYDNPSLRVNLSGLANTVNGGLGLVFEYPLAKYWSAEIEAGSLFYSSRTQSIGEMHRGLRARAAIKYFLGRYEKDNYYVKLLYKRNIARAKSYQLLWNFSGTYQEYRLLESKVNNQGGLLYLGYATSFGNNSRIVLDFAVGGGFVEHQVDPGLPAGFEFTEDRGWNLFGYTGTTTFLDASATLQLGFYFVRKRE